MELWQECTPVIKGCFMSPGVMEVFWTHPSTQAMGLIRGYQVLHSRYWWESGSFSQSMIDWYILTDDPLKIGLANLGSG